MDELAPFDHTLRRIITIGNAIDAREECIAVGDPACRARSLRCRKGTLHTACRVRMGRCPFRNARVPATLDPGVERVLKRQALQNAGHGTWIVARLIEITNAEPVSLQFLRAGELQGQQLRALENPLRDLLSDAAVAEEDTRKD